MRSDGGEHNDPRHDTRITALQPTELGLEACKALGVETVAQFLDRDEQAFLDLRRCTPQTYRSLRGKVERHLARRRSAKTADPAGDPGRPLRTLVKSPRALNAFAELSLETVADFVACPRAEFLRVRGVGERTYEDILQRIRTYANGRPSVLPTRLTTYPVTALELPPNVLGRLSALQASSVGDALQLPPDMLTGPDLRAVRAGIDRLLCSGLGGYSRRRRGRRTSFRAFIAQIDAVLDVEEADLWPPSAS